MSAKKSDDLDGSIRKMMEGIYGDEIEGKIEEKISELRGELQSARREPDVSPLISSVRDANERITRLENVVGRLESAGRKDQPSQGKIMEMVEDEMERLSSGLKEELGRCKDMISDIRSQISGIHELFSEMREIHEALKGVDMKGMSREIESLKQKASWLEQSSGSANIDGIKERLEEIEMQMKGVRLGSPLVIE